MNPFFLPTLKAHLAGDLAALNLVGRGKGNVPDAIRQVRVFIGDLPAKRPGEQDFDQFPCVLLVPSGGFQQEGADIASVGCICAVYNQESSYANSENGDAEGAEMDLALLVSAVKRSLKPFLKTPLDKRYLLTPDTSGRLFVWERAEGQPRPYAQSVMLTHWRMPGLE